MFLHKNKKESVSKKAHPLSEQDSNQTQLVLNQ